MAKYAYNFFSPLINFTSEDDEIILGENMVIMQASESDLKILDDLKRKWSNIGASNRLLSIQINKDEPETEPDIYLPDARKEIEKAITLLRLYKEESIGFNIIVSTVFRWSTLCVLCERITPLYVVDPTPIKQTKANL